MWPTWDWEDSYFASPCGRGKGCSSSHVLPSRWILNNCSSSRLPGTHYLSGHSNLGGKWTDATGTHFLHHHQRLGSLIVKVYTHGSLSRQPLIRGYAFDCLLLLGKRGGGRLTRHWLTDRSGTVISLPLFLLSDWGKSIEMFNLDTWYMIAWTSPVRKTAGHTSQSQVKSSHPFLSSYI